MPKRTEHPSAAVRIRVMKRDRFQCTYCGTPGTDAELEIDHIIPVSRGGSNHMSNLTTACRACNQTKSNGTLGPMIKAKQASGLVGIYINTFENKKINGEWFNLSEEDLKLIEDFYNSIIHPK